MRRCFHYNVPARPGAIRPRVAAALASVLLLAGCVGIPGDWSAARVEPVSYDGKPVTGGAGGAPVSQQQRRILDAADEMLATQNFVVDGYRYSYDCTGTILAIYARAGIRLVDLFPQYTGNGVRRLYGIAQDHALLYRSTTPQPGDLIFWDNTYDRNGDELWNDTLTHVGLVLSVSPDGEIEYLHHHYTDGVVRARMNLNDPETYMDDAGVIVNSPMRMRSHRYLNPDQWLASQLFRELGAMYRIRM